jgi:hypothetical protein
MFLNTIQSEILSFGNFPFGTVLADTPLMEARDVINESKFVFPGYPPRILVSFEISTPSPLLVVMLS